MKKEYNVGLDLGGTKIAVAVCDTNGEILKKIKVSTNASSGPDVVINRIKKIIYEVTEFDGNDIEKISGIGISSPGPLSVSEGVVKYAATLGWENIPLVKIIEDEFKIPVYLENDCNAAAYGEKRFGAGRGFNNLIYITVSTGIGSGIIINQEIYHGKHDAAGEFGHICIEYGGRKCECGNRGCLQAYSSGTAIAKIATERKLRVDDTDVIDCLTVEKAAYNGDKIAKAIWEQAGIRLGQGISILMQMFDPDIVIIGGGVAKAWELFLEPVIKTVKENTYRLISGDMLITPAQLGENAGLIGAAMLALKRQGL